MNPSFFQFIPFSRWLSRLLLYSRVAASVDRTRLPFETGSTTSCDPFRRHFCGGIQSRALWEGSSYETLLRKLEFALQDSSMEEAWEAFSDFKRLHGFPQQQLVSKLIASLSYSSSTQWLRKAYDLAMVISEEKPHLARCESFSRLSLALARTQMPIPASNVFRVMLEHGKFPSKDILGTLFLHLVKSQIGSYLAADILIEICEYFLNWSPQTKKLEKINLMKPSITIFNLVLDSCVRFSSLVKARQIIELMPQVGIVADANSVVIIAKIYEMMGERGDLKNLKVHIDSISSAVLYSKYWLFYDSLLSLHFKYNDIDAAAELMLDLYRQKNSLHPSNGPPSKSNGSKYCYLQIGSSNLRTGNRIIIDPKKLENDFLIAPRSHSGLILFVDGKFVPSSKVLAKLINIYVKERKLDGLSNFLINIYKETDLDTADLCSVVLHACVMLGWLDTAHDIIDDLELAKVPIGANAYISLLNAYLKKNMWEESEVLLKQIRKGDLMGNLSDELGGSISTADDIAAYPIDKKSSNSLEKSKLVELLELENREYNFGNHLVYEFNSSVFFFCNAKMMEDALRTLKQMRQRNVQPTFLTFSYLVNGYSSLEMYRDITILWGEIRRQIECGALTADRDLFDSLLLNFLRGGYFERAMEVIDYMLKHNMYVDKWKYRREFLKYHKNLYRSLKASDCRTDAQSKRLEHVQAFRKWAGINQQ
ncbi:pentatricopeptide repeat-containing protein [Canna indica]|uniref:Pentatricopeptide repeat-containing protein n=1 Tax=Canna indica TaxID=4628 RepID=A0AAQ3QPB4_9LILI|nr:pentatricopeptide repeat-containing protein [Canna indica]